jgi:Secretion system C-terminal sorting domain
MFKFNKFIPLLFIFGYGVQNLSAQNAFVVCGGSASGTNGKSSYSVGLPIYQTGTGSGGTSSNGMQYAYEIFILGTYEAQDISLSVSAFPNPTVDNLQLKIDTDFEQFTYELYNIKGELIDSAPIQSSLTQIAMAHLPTSAYLIKVFKSKNQIISYKIIKNN